MSVSPSGRRIRIAALMVVAGLLVEAISLTTARAASFLAFIFVAGTLLLVGVVLFGLAVWRGRPS